MSFYKQMLILLLITLLYISIYKDLTVEQNLLYVKHSAYELDTIDYEIISYPVKSGDTLLSIMENMDDHILSFKDIDDIINDFNSLNPKANVYQLVPGKEYLFPVYK